MQGEPMKTNPVTTLVEQNSIEAFCSFFTGVRRRGFEGLYEEVIMTTPQHSPGFQQFKHLQSFICKCPNCGKERKIFSDEFDKNISARGCGEEIDFTQCAFDGEA
jgi:L-amino acid N-acyltransferase YncA